MPSRRGGTLGPRGGACAHAQRSGSGSGRGRKGWCSRFPGLPEGAGVRARAVRAAVASRDFLAPERACGGPQSRGKGGRGLLRGSGSRPQRGMAGRWRAARAGSRRAEGAEGTEGARSSARLALACTRSSARFLTEAVRGPADCGGDWRGPHTNFTRPAGAADRCPQGALHLGVRLPGTAPTQPAAAAGSSSAGDSRS